jgi:fatty acid desaturase
VSTLSLLRKFIVAYLFQGVMVLLFIGTALWALWSLGNGFGWWFAPAVVAAWAGFITLYLRNDRHEKSEDDHDKG